MDREELDARIKKARSAAAMAAQFTRAEPPANGIVHAIAVLGDRLDTLTLVIADAARKPEQ